MHHAVDKFIQKKNKKVNEKNLKFYRHFCIENFRSFDTFTLLIILYFENSVF